MANQNITIILWNLSGDKSVKAAERNQDVRSVALWIKNNLDVNAFILLCQDQITRKKHAYINENISHRPVKNGEATVYINGDNVQTTYLDISFLYQIYSGITLNVGNDFTPVRLQAYVLGGRTLIVSWHGPRKKLERKLACFDALVTFVEAVKMRHNCAIAIIGGDFNIFVNYLRKHVEVNPQHYGAAELNLGVYCQYTPTEDRPKNGLLDYVVAWPQTRVTLEENKVLFDTKKERFIPISLDAQKKERFIRRSLDAQKKDSGRPFDHNIVHYKLALS